MKLRYGIAIFFACFTMNASAVLISAADWPVGTNLSNLDPNAHVSVVTSTDPYGNNGIAVPQYSDAFVEHRPETSSRAFIGDLKYFDGTYSNLLLKWNYGTTLEEMLSQKDGPGIREASAVLISYIEPTRQIYFSALDFFGDGVQMLLFDKDQRFIGEKNAWGTPHREVAWGEENSVFLIDTTTNFNMDVHYVLLGGRDTIVYITSINTSLPEPGMLALLFMGIAGVFLNRKRIRS